MVELGVTGTQIGWTKRQAWAVYGILVAFKTAGAVWMNEGDCIGADARFNDCWRLLKGKIRQHPPINERKRAHRPFDETEKARDYLVRNREIVKRCSVLIATPKEKDEQERGSGTWATIRYALAAGKPVIIVHQDGTIVHNGVMPHV